MNNKWAERVKSQMKAQGMTQDKLADALSCTRASISHYLNGRRNPTVNQFQAIARAISVEPQWLLEGERGDALREQDGLYQAQGLLLPVKRFSRSGLKKRAISYLSIPTPTQNCFAVVIDNDQYSPRIYAGEIILVDPDASCHAGDEVIVHYRNGKLMLHAYLYNKKGTVSLDSLVGKKKRKNVHASEINLIYKIIAVFRSSELVN